MDAHDVNPRVRVRIACEECRKGKRKCDGQKPTCSLCAKSGRICQYESELTRKRKNYDETLVAGLQEEIRLLRAALERQDGSPMSADAQHRVRSDPPHDGDSMTNRDIRVAPDAHTQRAHVPAMAAANTSGKVLNPKSQIAMEELSSLMLHLGVEDFGEPSFSIPAGKARRDSELDYSFPKAVDSWTKPNSTRSQNLTVTQIQHLVDCFMTEYNPYHQFLTVEEAFDIKQSASNKSDEIDTRFRNLAVFAVASSYSPNSDIRAMESELYIAAEAMALRAIRERPNDLVVQGLSLLAWRESMFGAASMAYNWIAMATGQVLHIGLHVTGLKTAAGAHNIDAAAHSRKIRSFWAYFSVDRVVSSGLGMNCTMHWQRVKLPTFISSFPTIASVDQWAHERFCQLWHLWDSCMDQGYAFSWSALKEDERENLIMHSHSTLSDFRRQDDISLHIHQNQMPDTAVWYHMSYHAAIILISRPLINQSHKNDAGLFALRSATTSALSITRIIREYRKQKPFLSLAPQVVDFLLVAADIHLLNATTGKTHMGRQAANGIKCCLEALSEMEQVWHVRAKSSIERIQELAHRWEVVWALPIQFSQPLENQMPTSASSFDFLNQSGSFPQHDIFDSVAMGQSIAGLWESNTNPVDSGLLDNTTFVDLDSSYLRWITDP